MNMPDAWIARSRSDWFFLAVRNHPAALRVSGRLHAQALATENLLL
jgi:hypothetical protein